MSPRVAVVILNYNGAKYLEQFLPAVLKHTAESAEIIVADNASTDRSTDLLRTNFPRVRILSLPSNEGYAGGYNRALEEIAADYYILLNSDVEVTPGWIEPVIHFMDQRPEVAACQPKIKSWSQKEYFEYAGAAGGFIDRFGYPFCRGRIFDTLEKDTGQYDEPSEVFWASGACLFIRAACFHESGGFDESFFAHMEEIDLCWRLKKRGYQVFAVPSSTVYHVGGGTLEKANPHKTFLNFRNNLRMLKKNLSPEEFKKVMTARIFMDMLAAGKNLATLNTGNFTAIIRAYYHFLTYRAKNTIPDPGDAALNKELLTGMFRESIVWQYYVKGKKIFAALDKSLFTSKDL